MKILKSSQVRELDAYTIANEPISSWELMERASRKFTQWLLGKFADNRVFHVFCGMGNNGGDGLAISRILSGKGYIVRAYIVRHREKGTPDFELNAEKLKYHLTPVYIDSPSDYMEPQEGIIIDALLGSGLKNAVTGLLAEVIQRINNSARLIVSVDIASGLYDDRMNDPGDVIITPHYTVAFQCPRLSFVIPQCERFVGEWHVVDIGLSEERMASIETDYFLTTRENLPHLIRKRGKFSHKGTFGHALLLAGSYGKMGAAVLAAKACMRSGAGLLTTFIPRCGYEIMQISLPEAMVLTDTDELRLTGIPSLQHYSAVGIGPGIGTEPDTAAALVSLLQSAGVPVVIDADGLNILAANSEFLAYLKENTILTPHPKEFSRLAGSCSDGFEMIRKAQDFAQKFKVIICLKGAHTAVVLPDRKVYFNTTGNPGMATGGSGDVLTGVVLGLLAQGYAPEVAARLAVFKHGEAGDHAAARKSGSALIASDLVEYLTW